MLSLEAVLVGVAVLVLTDLILGVELVAGDGRLRNSNRLTDEIRLGDNGLVNDILLLFVGRLDCNVCLLLVDGLSLDNDLLRDNGLSCDVGLRLADNVLLGFNCRLDCGVNEAFLWLVAVLWCLNFDNLLNFFFGLAGNGFGDELQVFLSGGDDFWSVFDGNWKRSGSAESGLVSDVVDGLDLPVGVDIVVITGDDAVSALGFVTNGVGIGVTKLSN